MLFSSFEFIFLFLPISFIIYFYLNYKRLLTLSKGWLLFVSLFFYSWWNISYLPLILISILFNFVISGQILEDKDTEKRKISKKSLLIIGLLFNICFLAYFKYMDFFIQNANFLFNSKLELLNLALPLAISFFTLQQIAYLVDCYEGLVKEKDFINYSIFVTFFPQLIAGPIVHHKEIMPQFENLRKKVINYKNISVGLFIFSMGLFKKIVIADTFGEWTALGFSSSTKVLGFFDAWIASLSFTLQVYFDFSAYSDMAIGIALLFNIYLPINFNSPLKARNIIDFWARWHMTLTNFIAVYIYTPMIRSFKKLTFVKAMIVTVISFVIVGFWHGASWNFIVFGFLHGVVVVINHYMKKYKISFHYLISWFLTFLFINFTFVIFRAETWDDAFKVLKGMFGFNGSTFLESKKLYVMFFEKFFYNGSISEINSQYIIFGMESYIWIFVFLIIALKCNNSLEIVKYPTLLDKKELTFKKVVFFPIILLIALFYMSIQKYTEFIYFNF